MNLDQHTAPPQLALRPDLLGGAAATASRSGPSTLAPALRNPGLLVFEGSALNTVLPLGSEPVTIGRDADCSIRVGDSAVSRLHCSVQRRDGDLLLTDRGSTNGTFRCGKRVDSVLLSDGDEITVGLVLIKLVDLAEPAWRSPRDAFARLYLDPQSGLLNRRGLRLRVDACCSVLPPTTELGLLMFGLRDYRRGCDGPGTAVDAALAGRVARAIGDSLPATAYAARIGSDQFSVAVFGVEPVALRALAERMRARFDKGASQDPEARFLLDIGSACGRITSDGPRALFCLSTDSSGWNWRVGGNIFVRDPALAAGRPDCRLINGDTGVAVSASANVADSDTCVFGSGDMLADPQLVRVARSGRHPYTLYPVSDGAAVDLWPPSPPKRRRIRCACSTWVRTTSSSTAPGTAALAVPCSAAVNMQMRVARSGSSRRATCTCRACCSATTAPAAGVRSVSATTPPCSG